MALTIQNYRQPGAYSTVVPNPTVATSNGPAIVAIIGQALRGSYNPSLFFNPSDAQASYGTATQANPLALGIQFAFLNGAKQVIGLNVQPDNSTPAFFNIPLTSLPVSAYTPAPSSTLDAVTNQPVNTTGNVVGTFYIQDYNTTVADTSYGTDFASIQSAYRLAGKASMLQYEQLIGSTATIPLANSAQSQINVYTVQASNPPVTSISQAGWNQFLNATALANAFNGAFQAPVTAEMLLPDTGATTSASPGFRIPGYVDLYASVGRGTNGTPPLNAGTINAKTITSITDAYDYAINHGGILYVSALGGGTQHQILVGLFDSNLASVNSTNGQALFGTTPPSNLQNGSSMNPYAIFNSGSDGVVTNASYVNALTQLTAVRADIVVVLNTDPSIQLALKNHVTSLSGHDERNERIGITSGPISELDTTTIQNVTALQGGPQSERMVYMWPTAAYYYDPIVRTTVALDGTYLACAAAGILTSADSATPLTHKVLTGFRDVAYHPSNSAANAIAKYGVSIVENNPTFGLRVRHGLTCNPTSAETQEISVVRQLDYVSQRLRDVMDANIIATKITRSTLGVVTSLITNALQATEESQIIYGYKNVFARINPNDPRQIDVVCSIRPAYPCDYVEITINVTSSLEGF